MQNKWDSVDSSGYTLIEVLVAVLVLAVGMLGLAALQVATLRNNRTANIRTRATEAAYVITDRLRSNKSGIESAAYSSNALVSDESTVDCEADVCDQIEMAAYDLKSWAVAIQAELPNGKGAVCLDSTPDDGSPEDPSCDLREPTYAVKVWWDEKVPAYKGASSDSREGENENDIVVRRFTTSLQP